MGSGELNITPGPTYLRVTWVNETSWPSAINFLTHMLWSACTGRTAQCGFGAIGHLNGYGRSDVVIASEIDRRKLLLLIRSDAKHGTVLPPVFIE